MISRENYKYILYCDNCGEEVEEEFQSFEEALEYKRNNWSSSYGEDLCPTCSGKDIFKDGNYERFSKYNK